MEKSLYPEAVEVHQAQPAYTESSKARHILQRWADGATMGVQTGLEVSINTTPTLVDIGVGRGYTPSGDLIEVDAAVVGLSLANYTAATDNYVCLVYTETETRREAQVTGGTTSTTRAVASYRTRVFTFAELAALPASSDDLSIDARDRVLICGIVNANGINVSLTAADLTLPDVRLRILSMEQPSDIPGIEILEIDQETSTTAEVASANGPNPLARLTYTLVSANPIVARLKYRAPGDTTNDAAFAALVGTLITSGGAPFPLTSPQNGRTIVVGVAVPALMELGAAGNVTQDLEVTEMYHEDVTRAGANDAFHRRQAGNSLPRVANPHGVSLKDLADTNESRHTLFLGTALLDTLRKSGVPRIFSEMAALGSRTLIWEQTLQGTTSRVRIYANANFTLDITVNAKWYDDGGATQNWQKDDNAQAASKLAIFGTGIAQYSHAAVAGPFTEAQWTSNPLYVNALAGVDSQGLVEVDGQAQFGENILSSVARQLAARAIANYSTASGGVRTLLFQSSLSGGSGDRNLRIYRSESSLLIPTQTGTLEIVTNASWDGTNWQKDIAGSAASKLEIGRNYMFIAQRLAASGATFTDNAAAGGWDARFITFDLASGSQVIGGDLGVDGTTGIVLGDPLGEYRWAGGRTFYQAVSASNAFVDGDWVVGSGAVIEKSTLIVTVTEANIPLMLPNDAVVTGVVVHARITLNTGTVSFNTHRHARDTSATLTALSSTGVAGTSTGGNFADFVIPIDQNQTVDNQVYSYFTRVNTNGNCNVEIAAVFVEYTQTRVVLP